MSLSESPRLETFDRIVADVLASIPEGSSPVFCLLPEIWASPQALAPEKVKSLVPLLRQIKLYPKTGEFQFATSGEYIHISDGALNLVWCASYASWFIYQAFGKARGQESVRFDDDHETLKALDLYQWAIRCVRYGIYESWPVGAPLPTRTPPPGSFSLLANEIFLATVGWMLLHEFGHLAHDHPLVISPRAKDEENEADLFATQHVLGRVSDEDVRFKRGVGLVVGNIVLLLLELIHGQALSQTHPPVEERLSRNLRGRELETNDRIHAFATALVQFHLGVFDVEYQLVEHNNFGEFVDDFCVALNRWRKITSNTLGYQIGPS